MSNRYPENSNHQNHAAVLRITHQNQSSKQTKDVLVIHPSLGSLGLGFVRNGIWKPGIFKGEKGMKSLAKLNSQGVHSCPQWKYTGLK